MEQSHDTDLMTGPFAWLVAPETLQAAAERGDSWKLRRRVCRPLDQPFPSEMMGRQQRETAALDAMIEAQTEPEEQDAEEALAETA